LLTDGVNKCVYLANSYNVASVTIFTVYEIKPKNCVYKSWMMSDVTRRSEYV